MAENKCAGCVEDDFFLNFTAENFCGGGEEYEGRRGKRGMCRKLSWIPNNSIKRKNKNKKVNLTVK